MGNEATHQPLSSEDRKTRITSLLRQIDNEIKSGNFDHALLLTQQVYSFDRKNLYARAFEERIHELRESKKQGILQPEVQKSSSPTVQPISGQDVQKFQSVQQEKQAETLIHMVEQRHEVIIPFEAESSETEKTNQPSVESDVLFEDDDTELTEDIEQQLMQKIHLVLESKQQQIEETFQRQLRDLELSAKSAELGNVPPVHSQQHHVDTPMVPLKIKEQQENDLREWLVNERKRILDELTGKLKEEQQEIQENLAQHYKSTYEKKLEEETQKAHQQALTAYRSTVATLLQYKLPKLVQQAITRTLRTPLLITDEEHERLEHQAHIDLYTNALLEVLTKETIAQTDWDLLAKQRVTYGITEEEHRKMLKQVKRDLDLPDDTAIIFIIDDDPVILAYTSHILKQIYPNVHTAESAQAAEKFFEEHTPSLIICDVNLPGMGGFTFYENILNGVYGEEIKSIPFIFASSLGDQFIINGAKKLGAKAYLVKPISKEILEGTVKNALQ